MSRLGVIGYGRRMRHILQTIDRYHAGAEVVAVLDPQQAELRSAFPDALAEVTFCDDVDRLLEDFQLDGVLIGTRCTLHTPYAVKVLDRNLPLFSKTGGDELGATRHAPNGARTNAQPGRRLVSLACFTAL